MTPDWRPRWLFSNKSTQSPTGFSPNPYDCRRFGNYAAPKTRIRLSGDFGGPMPTGLKGHQQLWSGCAAKPSERQSRPLGAATQPVTLNCRANVTRRLGGLDEALSLWDITYLCWNLTSYRGDWHSDVG